MALIKDMPVSHFTFNRLPVLQRWRELLETKDIVGRGLGDMMINTIR